MKTLYFDCFSGISGDMTIGALLDIGLGFEDLRRQLEGLPIDGYELRYSRVDRAGIHAVKFDVLVEDSSSHTHTHVPDNGNGGGKGGPQRHAHSHAHRKASEIVDMIQSSPLDSGVKKRSVAIFEKLAVSEGEVHDLPPEDVEFHEVGAIDSIVDVVGTAIGLEALGVEQILCSQINIGGGFVHCQHGVYPVPVPATANLLKGAPVYSKHVERELVTPTGAAILAASVERFGTIDGLRIRKVGYGAGTNDFGKFPNCLRIFEVDPPEDAAAAGADEVMLIEANIDDMSAEQLSYAAEKLMWSGAIDVVTIPVLMKKGRPGHMLQVMTGLDKADRISRVVFEETTTIGVRMRPVSRRLLLREIVEVPTTHGPIRVKVSRLANRVLTISPEYDDCARVARETDRPFHEIRDDAIQSYRQQVGDRTSDG